MESRYEAVQRDLGALSDITAFLNTSSCPEEVQSELQERQLYLITELRCNIALLLSKEGNQ